MLADEGVYLDSRRRPLGGMKFFVNVGKTWGFTGVLWVLASEDGPIKQQVNL